MNNQQLKVGRNAVVMAHDFTVGNRNNLDEMGSDIHESDVAIRIEVGRDFRSVNDRNDIEVFLVLHALLFLSVFSELVVP